MDIGLLINGEERAATGGASYVRNDPFTGKPATKAAAATVADVNAAIDNAAAAFPAWSKT
jgi:acyl-CoA reductase-like NAD-dependent aldehyde dehydrogenase